MREKYIISFVEIHIYTVKWSNSTSNLSWSEGKPKSVVIQKHWLKSVKIKKWRMKVAVKKCSWNQGNYIALDI